MKNMILKDKKFLVDFNFKFYMKFLSILVFLQIAFIALSYANTIEESAKEMAYLLTENLEEAPLEVEVGSLLIEELRSPVSLQTNT